MCDIERFMVLLPQESHLRKTKDKRNLNYDDLRRWGQWLKPVMC